MQQTADKLIAKLILFKNGIVSESMIEKGVDYPMNYGVAIKNIGEAAKDYYPDHELAVELFSRPEREAKLAAFYIDDPAKVTEQQLDEWSHQFTNSEIVEQASLRLLPKIPFISKYITRWAASDDEYLQKAAWMTIGRQAAQKNDITAAQLNDYFALAEKANLNSIHVRSALIFAFPAIAMHCPALRATIIGWTEKQAASTDANTKYVAAEIRAFI